MDRVPTDYPTLEKQRQSVEERNIPEGEELPYTPQDEPYEITFRFTSTPRNEGHGTQYSKQAWVNTPENQDVFRHVLSVYEEYLNVKFVETSADDDTANIDFSERQYKREGLGAHGGAGRLEFDENGNLSQYEAGVTFSLGTDLKTDPRGVNIAFHEVAHALNLTHTYNTETWNQKVLDGPFGKYSNEKYTTMGPGRIDDTGKENNSPGVLDVHTLQKLWGGKKTSNEGDTTYKGDTQFNIQTIWDTGGHDTLDASARTNDVELHLYDGAFSNFKGGHDDVAIALGVTIEDAKGGSGNDLITGNDTKNGLFGNAGNDKLQGRGGDDMIDGGEGIDEVKFSGNASDYEIRKAADGSYTVEDTRETTKTQMSDGTDTVKNVEKFTFKDGTKTAEELTLSDGPDKPEEPTTPDKPEEPTTPDKPEEPSTPDKPEEPTTPPKNEQLTFKPGEFNELIGGEGADTADYSQSTFAVYADLEWRGGGTVTKGNESVYSKGPWEHVAKMTDVENIIGSKFDDRLVGDKNDNVLTGGGGADQFKFNKHFGHDTITDYVDNDDFIRIQRACEGDGFKDLEISQDGANAVIKYHDNSITLENVNASDLNEYDFAFG